jgi:general secretion pathway protein L
MASPVSNRLEEFLRWWGGELKALVPRSQGAGRGRAARRLVLSVEGPRRRLLLEKGAQFELLDEVDDAGGDSLKGVAKIVKSRSSLPFGLRVPSQDCFSRTVELPAQAEGNFGRILELDMERTTPFRSADVMTAHYAVPGMTAARGKRAVRHLIVKRRTLEPLIADLRALGVEPAFADCWDEERRAGLPADFLASARGEARRGGLTFAPVMAGLAVLLAVSAVAILIVRHQSALEALQARSEAARVEAAKVRAAVEASQSASAQIAAIDRMLHARLPAAKILEELTLIMPDTAWISDLRIDGDVVEFTAYAKSAAALVPLLAKSPLFTEASLTSPVILDTVEDKERFSVRLRLKEHIAMPTEGAEAAHEGSEARL